MQLNAHGTDPAWEKIEAKFRFWSFRIYFHRRFAKETDPALRFAKALIASCQPIRDRHAVLNWYQQRQRKPQGGAAQT